MGLRIAVKPIPDSWRNLRSWCLIFAVLALGVLARWVAPSAHGSPPPAHWLPPCIFKRLTGFPCPFCGLTTGSAWLTRGHLAEAWNSNILAPFLGVALAVLMVYVVAVRLCAGRAVQLEIDSGLRRRLWMIGGLLLAVSWVLNLTR